MEAYMLKSASSNETKQFNLSRWTSYILPFLYGFLMGGCSAVFSLDSRVREAWKTSTSVNVPLFNLVDDIVGYYVVYALIFFGLIVVTLGWKLTNKIKRNSK